MATPKIAIMMASLNHEKFVEEAIESIYAQNYPNLKVVVCDDASTDGNLERLELLARKYGFVLLRNDVRQHAPAHGLQHYGHAIGWIFLQMNWHRAFAAGHHFGHAYYTVHALGIHH